MKALVFLLAISRLTRSHVIPYQGVTVGIKPHSAPIHSHYFHEQNNAGQYVYGYASRLHSKDEIKTADGITRGGYSYIDAAGNLQTVQYISDPINGFRVSATNIPHDLPEVALAKARHFHAFETIKAEHAYIAALQKDHAAVSFSPLPPRHSIVVPVSVTNIADVPQTNSYRATNYIPVPLTSQYHEQDKIGQYTYGYAGPLSSKTETKTADGITRGGYSYIDANGLLQSVQYISDPVNGFRVEATNLPKAPEVILVGPKVTNTVIGPKDHNIVETTGTNTNPIATEFNPLSPSEIHSVSLQQQNDYIPNVQHKEYASAHSSVYISGPDQFVNPIILSKNENIFEHSQGKPTYENNPVLINPPALSNPIHNIPFHGNGRIVTHDGQINNLNNQEHIPISDNIEHFPHNNYFNNLENHQNIPNIASQTIHKVIPQNSPSIFNPSGHEHSFAQPQHSQTILSPPNSINSSPQLIQNVHQPINPKQIYVEPPLFSPSQAVNIPTGSSNVLINNAPPNYQIPINPGQGVGTGAISKDIINSDVLNQHGVYQGQGEFLRGPVIEEQPQSQSTYDGSINAGIANQPSPPLFLSKSEHIQQVPQTPVNAGVDQQAFYNSGTAQLNEPRDNSGSGYEIIGPSGNPNVQPSGYYTQNIDY